MENDIQSIKSDLQRLLDTRQREETTFTTLRDNLSSLIGLISLINERILQSLKEVEKNSKNDEDHKQRHAEIQSLISKIVSDLSLISLELRQHGTDTERIERRTEKYDVQVRDIQESLEKLQQQVEDLYDTIKQVRDRLPGQPQPDTGVVEARRLKWNLWTVVLAALITSGALWKIIELIIAAARRAGGG